MIRINQIKISVNSDESAIRKKIIKALHLKPDMKFTYTIAKKSIDARKKDNLLYIYCVNVVVENINEVSLVNKLHDNNIMLTNDKEYAFPELMLNKESRIVIAGSGPAGLFCGLMLARAGYKPVIYERGASVHERTAIVNAFWENGVLDTHTNVQFGEGGAGTFSDGKLNSVVKEKNGRIHQVLKTFVEYGAPGEIMYINKPHIGTDILATVVENIRNDIIALGGQVIFNSQITSIHIENNRVSGIRINDSYDEYCDRLVLAIGHSARDTFEMLIKLGLPMEPKAFAVGMRIIHPQGMINNYAYGNEKCGRLPVADYKVTAKAANGRGVYSFCMCPGGYVVNASSEEGMTCVNGMSMSRRDSGTANSAIVVTVEPADFGKSDVLSGMHYQRNLESAAYKAGQGKIPFQLNSDFQEGKKSAGYGSFIPDFKGLNTPANLREVLPEYLCESVIDGMKSFDKIVEGFNMEDAVWAGVESRTSSPVRMIRGDDLMSTGIVGIYPCGEGAGYAGGITSAAVDGIKVAEAVALS